MPAARKQPLRTCAACRTGADKRALVRFVRVKDGADTRAPAKGQPGDAGYRVHLDPSGRMAGRGAYLCWSKACFEKARKAKALERALRCPISADDYERLATEFVDWCSTEQDRVGTVLHG